MIGSVSYVVLAWKWQWRGISLQSNLLSFANVSSWLWVIHDAGLDGFIPWSCSTLLCSHTIFWTMIDCIKHNINNNHAKPKINNHTMIYVSAVCKPGNHQKMHFCHSNGFFAQLPAKTKGLSHLLLQHIITKNSSTIVPFPMKCQENTGLRITCECTKFKIWITNTLRII